MKDNFPFRHFLVFALVLGFNTPAQGSVVYKMSPAELAQEAHEVRIGEVVSTWTSPDPEKKIIYTYVKIKVDRTLKGEERSEVLLRQAGGKYQYADTGQTFRQKIFGMESFTKGEKGIFFIKHTQDGAPTVMFQGKHNILKDPETGQPQAARSYAKDVHYVDKNMRTLQSKHRAFAKQEVRPLTEVIRDIEAAVQKQKEQNHMD